MFLRKMALQPCEGPGRGWGGAGAGGSQEGKCELKLTRQEGLRGNPDRGRCRGNTQEHEKARCAQVRGRLVAGVVCSGGKAGLFKA